MKVIWTSEARSDLAGISEYIRQDSPDAARRVATVIFQRTRELKEFPLRGRKRTEGYGRELIFAPWPYIAVYEVVGAIVYIKAIRHASQDAH